MKHRDALPRQRFDNLTKTLGFSGYAIRYVPSASQRSDYIEHIDGRYNARALARIMQDLALAIDAKILDLVQRDYRPQGASAAMLVAGEQAARDDLPASPATRAAGALLAHLDKSHISIHTYPEPAPGVGVNTFRVDLEVATCGHTSPLSVLNRVIDEFDSEVILVDYRVRGFARDARGRKRFIDQPLQSIQQFIDADKRKAYRIRDTNLVERHIFHSRLLRRALVPGDCIVAPAGGLPAAAERRRIAAILRREMAEIFEAG